jgi:hypothetical protein
MQLAEITRIRIYDMYTNNLHFAARFSLVSTALSLMLIPEMF